MPKTLNIPAEILPLNSLKPAADAAGRTGAYVDLTLYHKVWFVFYLDQGNAATAALSLTKATSSGGAGATAVTENFNIYTNTDTVAATPFTRQAAGTSFTTDAGVKAKIVVFEVYPEAISMRWVAATTGASNAANITSAIAFGVPRYQFTN